MFSLTYIFFLQCYVSLWINFVCLYKNKTLEKLKPGHNLLSLMSMQKNIGCTDFYCMDNFSFLWVHCSPKTPFHDFCISFLWSLLCTTCHPLTKPLPSSFWEFSRVGKPTAWVSASISPMRVKQSGSNNLPTSYLVLTHCPLTQNRRPHHFCFQRV